mgnify:CR=1 FL=1
MLKKIIVLIIIIGSIFFIYSKYIYSGIVPLALALEYNGFEHYKAPLLQGDKMEPVMVGKNKAKYMIISGTQMIILTI